MKLAVLAAVTGFALAGVANADTYDPIVTRQAGQALVSADFAGIRAVVAAKGDVKGLVNPAKALARWIRQFPTHFPKGSEQGHGTRALPAIRPISRIFSSAPIISPMRLTNLLNLRMQATQTASPRKSR